MGRMGGDWEGMQGIGWWECMALWRNPVKPGRIHASQERVKGARVGRGEGSLEHDPSESLDSPSVFLRLDPSVALSHWSRLLGWQGRGSSGCWLLWTPEPDSVCQSSRSPLA